MNCRCHARRNQEVYCTETDTENFGTSVASFNKTNSFPCCQVTCNSDRGFALLLACCCWFVVVVVCGGGGGGAAAAGGGCGRCCRCRCVVVVVAGVHQPKTLPSAFSWLQEASLRGSDSLGQSRPEAAFDQSYLIMQEGIMPSPGRAMRSYVQNLKVSVVL